LLLLENSPVVEYEVGLPCGELVCVPDFAVGGEKSDLKFVGELCGVNFIVNLVSPGPFEPLQNR
jgi:hypothetical protein